MVQITIKIDGDKVTVNQSATPTKVEQNNKKFFIVISEEKYDGTLKVEFITDDYTEAINKLKDLRYSCNSRYYTYNLLMQEDRKVMPCKGVDWNTDR